MDHGTLGLPRSADLVMKTADKLISEFGLTAILVTHNLKDAYNYGNRIILMGEGKILKDINKEKKAGLKQNYLFTCVKILFAL